MPITVNSLLSAPSLEQLKIIAGYDGVYREITAISVMDAPDSYKWLKGGEFILTSGFIFGSDDWQVEHFISNLIKASCSAIGIKMGRFLSTIPETVIKIVNQEKFPIIYIPHNFGWSDIISVYYDIKFKLADTSDYNSKPFISISEQANNITDDNKFYQELLFKLHYRKITTSDLLEIENYQTHNRSYYGVLLVKGLQRDKAVHNIQDAFNSPQLQRKAKMTFHTLDLVEENVVIILLEAIINDVTQVNEFQYILAEELEYCVNRKDNYDISISGFHSGINGIIKAHSEAVESLDIGNIVWKDKNCLFYPTLSVYIALLKVNFTDVDFSYIDTLESYKKEIGFNGVENLEAYLENGYKKAAAMLFVHENTLRYRIHSIEDLLHININDSTICNTLITQIKLWKLKQEKFGLVKQW